MSYAPIPDKFPRLDTPDGWQQVAKAPVLLAGAVRSWEVPYYLLRSEQAFVQDIDRSRTASRS